MSRSGDSWYVRLPDNRVVRANSTRSVRHNIKNGEIPPRSFARRADWEPWVPLRKIDAFVDLLAERRDDGFAAASNGVQDSNGSTELQVLTTGVRGLANELITALETSLVRGKIQIASVGGLLIGLTLVGQVVLTRLTAAEWLWVLYLGVGGVVTVVVAAVLALLSQQTFATLAQLRPPEAKEAGRRVPLYFCHLLVCYLMVGGCLAGPLVCVEWLPNWLRAQSEPAWLLQTREALCGGLVVVRILWNVICLPVMGFSVLLAAIVIVEEAWFGRALLQWFGFVMRQLPRLLLYEAMATAITLIVSLPGFVAVAFAATQAPATDVARATLALLAGLALIPALTYLPVANVYIYLNLKYGHSSLDG